MKGAFAITLIVGVMLTGTLRAQNAENEETSAQETALVKSPRPCISEERIKESEEVKKRLGQLMREILDAGLSGRAAPPIDSEKRFSDAFQIAFAACKIRENAEIRLALNDKNFKKEQLEKVSSVATRMVAEFNARSRNATFSYSERSLLLAYLTASKAADVIEKAASPTLNKSMDKGQIQHATEASKIMLAEFNEKGDAASFSSGSKNVIDISSTVVLAAETIKQVQSPKFARSFKKEEIQEATEVSNRILAEFYRNEWKSKFANSDEGTLEKFRKALSAIR